MFNSFYVFYGCGECSDAVKNKNKSLNCSIQREFAFQMLADYFYLIRNSVLSLLREQGCGIVRA